MKYTKLLTTILFLSLIYTIFGTSCKKVNFNEVRSDFEIKGCPCEEMQNVYFVNKSDFADSYEWNFGDGYKDNRRNPEYRYDNQGKYTITLKAFRGNQVDEISKDILIYKGVE